MGPTASGKSDLAVKVALQHQAEIISLDASQVYRGLDIGTGKITTAEMQGVPHHLIDCVAPDEHFDAGVFRERADHLIEDIHARDKRVIICGGTGLYLKALLQGLCAAPSVDQDIEAKLEERIAQGEVEILHTELAQVDPKAAARIMPRDKQRISRALGVYLSHGTILSELQAQHQFAEERYTALILGLDPPRELLNARIEERIELMWSQGFLEEVKSLKEAGYESALQSMGAIGYRFALQVLDEELSISGAQEKMLYATRQYARRQRRFFDKQLPTQWMIPKEGEVKVSYEQIRSLVQSFWEVSAPKVRKRLRDTH